MTRAVGLRFAFVATFAALACLLAAGRAGAGVGRLDAVSGIVYALAMPLIGNLLGRPDACLRSGVADETGRHRLPSEEIPLAPYQLTALLIR
jgi:hypothetical protein